MLESVADDPDRSILTIDLLSDHERQQVLVEWNSNDREYPRESCIHELFEKQAEENAEAIAVQYLEENISYGELNRRGNLLGNYLKELGVGPEVMVGIMMDRGIEMIVSMLAILKAGGGYVPVEAEYPVERIAYLIEDAAIGIVVTKREYVGNVPGLMVQVVEVDEQWEIRD